MVERFRQIRLLGEGSFGKCYLVENPADGSLLVLKDINIRGMSDREKQEALNEAKILKAFDHPNIVRCYDAYTTPDGKLCILMDYADGGDLQSKIKGQRGRFFTEQQVLDWLVQMCLALKHVHDRKVLHRDIKGQNVFLTSKNIVKFGDFGIAKVLNSTQDKAKSMVGTPYYLSPEIVSSKPYNFKSDVWSLGVLLYELCTLKPPFDAPNMNLLSLKIARGQYAPIPPHYSSDLKNLVDTMLNTTPNRRPSVAQILRMPFIRSRIENFLTESVRFSEFSHTVIHNQDVFSAAKKLKNAAKPSPRNNTPLNNPGRDVYSRPASRDRAKPKEDYKYDLPLKSDKKKDSIKKKLDELKLKKDQEDAEKRNKLLEYNRRVEEIRAQHDEERQKMLRDLKKKYKETKKLKKPEPGENEIDWLGNYPSRLKEREDERLLCEMQVALQIQCDEEDKIEEEAEEKEASLIVIPPEEVKISSPPSLFHLITLHSHAEPPSPDKLHPLRTHIIDRIGGEKFRIAYRVIKDKYSELSEEYNYDRLLGMLELSMTALEFKETVPLIHTLIWMEKFVN
jgi:serine/threonine protein kinase